MIDTYDACMAAIYKERYPEDVGPVPSIKFKGLKNIFSADSEGFQGLQKLLLNSHQMPHPVKTKLTGDAELCRKLMLGIGGPDRAYIRQLIEKQEPDALGLYRGQTRFMLEDLADIPSVKSLSGKQKKKTAALVAEEMMSRNQAYSNLTELLLPNYVRLSIHAHNNAGPKFAIRLLPANMVRAIDSLETRLEPNPVYEYQLPTPWHNCMIKVEGDEFMYLAKAQVARKALESPDFDGSWVDGPDGSYFSLKRKSAATKDAVTLPELIIPGSTPQRRSVSSIRTRRARSCSSHPSPRRSDPLSSVRLSLARTAQLWSRRPPQTDRDLSSSARPLVASRPCSHRSLIRCALLSVPPLCVGRHPLSRAIPPQARVLPSPSHPSTRVLLGDRIRILFSRRRRTGCASSFQSSPCFVRFGRNLRVRIVVPLQVALSHCLFLRFH